MFLSKIAIHSFGGYANQQLNRLNNQAVRKVSQSDQESHILRTIEHATYDFARKYFEIPENSIHLYIDKAIQNGFDTEIFMDVKLKGYPLRDYVGMVGEMQNIIRSYSKLGKRNEHAANHNKLEKHMMHLVRLYLMIFDILEKKQIITYRNTEHGFLMDIRNGKYLDKNDQPVPEFFEIVNSYEKRLNYDKENTSLPDKPDYAAIAEFVASVNERVVKEEM